MKSKAEIQEKIFQLDKVIEQNEIRLRQDITDGMRHLCYDSLKDFKLMKELLEWVIGE